MKYIGIPFRHNGRTRQGADCLGIIYLYLNDHGLEIPPDDGRVIQENWHELEPQRFHKALLEYFEKVDDKPQKFDVILFTIKGKPRHCGVMIDNRRFLHLFKNRKSGIERLDRWQKRIYGVYRHKDVV